MRESRERFPTDPALLASSATLTYTPDQTGAEMVIPKLDDPRCVDTTIGWSLDFASTPKKLVLCPDTCALQRPGGFELVVGCVTGPGAH